MDPALFDSLRLELRRGCLTVAVLAQLRSEHYGYTLRKALADLGLDVDGLCRAARRAFASGREEDLTAVG